MNQLLQVGSSLTTVKSKSTCKVERFLGGGGQGEVYSGTIGTSQVAVKWYFNRSATDEQRQILEDLIGRGSPDQRFLWPIDLVVDRKMAGFGYVMRLRPSRFKGIVDLMKRRVEPSFRSLATAGYELADGFYQLHSAGLCYRDISFGNVFFDPNQGDVLICDNDNVVVNRKTAHGVLGTPKFMAPEIVRGEASPSRDTDLFSLSVLLFYMLMVHHPLEGKCELSIKVLDLPAMNRLYGTNPIFIFDPKNESNRPDPVLQQNAVEYWAVYPQFLKDLFTRSFTDGIRDPRHGRVKESEWRSGLVQLRDSIYSCSCKADNFYDSSAEPSKKPTCWHCRRQLPQPWRMQFGNKSVVVLNPDTKLYPHHLDPSESFNFKQVSAELVPHPERTDVWGLKNLTSKKWNSRSSDGQIKDVAPGQTAKLTPGITINFGGSEGLFLT